MTSGAIVVRAIAFDEGIVSLVVDSRRGAEGCSTAQFSAGVPLGWISRYLPLLKNRVQRPRCNINLTEL